jgi:hypothetical protein
MVVEYALGILYWFLVGMAQLQMDLFLLTKSSFTQNAHLIWRDSTKAAFYLNHLNLVHNKQF